MQVHGRLEAISVSEIKKTPDKKEVAEAIAKLSHGSSENNLPGRKLTLRTP